MGEEYCAIANQGCLHSIGYMEMKRVNQELASEVQCLREVSECKDRKHLDAINQLAEEIAEQKVCPC
jgi:hypothetical protein